MKQKRKISTREKWILALGPALAILSLYFLQIQGTLTANLATQKQRLTAAFAPAGPPAPSPAVDKARKTLEQARQSVATDKATLADLKPKIDSLQKYIAESTDDHDAAQVIGRVEAVFARNGITPVISEAVDERTPGQRIPEALIDVLSPKSNFGPGHDSQGPRIWHVIFDDKLPRFELALRQIVQEAPGVVPLSLNLVYNPANDGQTRQLELWLLY